MIAPLLPILPHRMFGWSGTQQKDRHRPGYWRDYHQRNITARRAYLAAKAREYRRK